MMKATCEKCTHYDLTTINCNRTRREPQKMSPYNYCINFETETMREKRIQRAQAQTTNLYPWR